ncbi:RSP_7527 family protein [Pseudotabrizicola algicola]|uniref:Uncharacterized protein n=1 Tax=Pseudotabrizicola algicola TaxID=2709381 RepID=A0A6B3RJ76_9RHOB|nr:hypothetical protein [Pseudotabrizicola algicola]NEX46087.1 hypothetical protein [Pseudotabrizicola algicola]
MLFPADLMPAAGQGQAPRLQFAGSGNAENAWTLLLQTPVATGIFQGREDRSKRKCPMSEQSVKIDHDAIMREARQLRAQAMADLMHSIISFFRRKPALRGVAKA